MATFAIKKLDKSMLDICYNTVYSVMQSDGNRFETKYIKKICSFYYYDNFNAL